MLHREFSIRERDGKVDERSMTSPDELLMLLDSQFGMAVPACTQFPCSGLDWTDRD